MSIRNRILAAIQSQPGIDLSSLKAALPDLKRRQVHNALAELRQQGRIESPAHGCYCLPVPRTRPSAGANQTAPLSRLMAGR